MIHHSKYIRISVALTNANEKLDIYLTYLLNGEPSPVTRFDSLMKILGYA